MKKLLLSLLLAASPAIADAPELQVFTARAQGTLTIGTDGRVMDVELTSEGNLGTGVLEGYEQRVRGWRFQPIIEDGVAVNVKGLLQLSLAAAREKGNDTATFGIRSVQFLDPAAAGAPAPASWGQVRITPPGYPPGPLQDGIGAEVGLVLKLDPQGNVVSAAAERVELLGVSSRQGHLSHLEAQFRRSAERGARNWTFAGFTEGDVVRVPVRYVMPQQPKGWVQTVIRPVQPPEWVQLENARAQAVELSADGLAVSTQIKLLTPLDEA